MRGGFDDAWSLWRSRDALTADWPGITLYLERLLEPDGVDKRYWMRGYVQTAISSGHSELYGCVSERQFFPLPTRPSRWQSRNRSGEGSSIPSEHAVALKAGGLACETAIRSRTGNELDAIGCGLDGNLLAIEVKPADEIKGITWGPAQVQMYVELSPHGWTTIRLQSTSSTGWPGNVHNWDSSMHDGSSPALSRSGSCPYWHSARGGSPARRPEGLQPLLRCSTPARSPHRESNPWKCGR